MELIQIGYYSFMVWVDGNLLLQYLLPPLLFTAYSFSGTTKKITLTEYN